MRAEVRVFDHRLLFNQVYCRALDGAGISTISFGSESCYRQLPTLLEIDKITGAFDHERLKLVVPLCFESQFPAVTEVLDYCIGKVSTIAVNDLGILHYLSRRHDLENVRIAIGAGLFYSYMECPWHNHIIRDEPEEAQEALLRGNLENAWMIDFLQEYVRWPLEIEIPAIPSLLNASESMRRAGYELCAVLDGVPVSFSRACHTCRYHSVSPAKCSRQCLQAVRLKSTHRWDFFEGDVKEIRPIIRQQMPDYLVWGNVIYVENDAAFSVADAPGVSRVIVDTRFGSDVTSIKRKLARVGLGEFTDVARESEPKMRSQPWIPEPTDDPKEVFPDGCEAGFEDDDVIVSRVRAIVAQVLAVDSSKISPHSHYVKDLAADSLSGVKVILAIEDEFDIQIDEQEVTRLPTVGMTVAYLRNRLQGK